MIDIFSSELDSLGQFISSNFPRSEEKRHVMMAVSLDMVANNFSCRL